MGTCLVLQILCTTYKSDAFPTLLNCLFYNVCFTRESPRIAGMRNQTMELLWASRVLRYATVSYARSVFEQEMRGCSWRRATLLPVGASGPRSLYFVFYATTLYISYKKYTLQFMWSNSNLNHAIIVLLASAVQLHVHVHNLKKHPCISALKMEYFVCFSLGCVSHDVR